ncbi:MAG: hypothetical protein JWP25_7035 [Bradyrhizobium sp.]|jgi:hypothetical protein|nr:hypothetical protein [Bradyrhizobium sp.]MEA2867026.1 hypothetical protein [Bradyrhizobium sp.]
MINKDMIMTTARRGRLRGIAMLSVIMVGLGCSMLASPASAQSLTDRFKSLFGGKTEEPAAGTPPPVPDGEADQSCPPVSIRAGASTFAVAVPGKEAVGNDLRYQATITRTARDCTRTGGDITARIGIQGRVIAGPAGAPGTVEIPLRVAVVQGGVQEKTIATKVYRTTVPMSEDGSVPFTLVAEDMVYPAPPGATGDSYIFYIGFDPQALTPEPKAAVKRKKK